VNNTSEITDLLRQGIAAAKAGQNRRARDLLTQVIDRDEHNEQAWLWLSSVVESLDDRRLCLEQVLAINPGNVHARAGLRQIEQSVTPPSREAQGEGDNLEQRVVPSPSEPSPTRRAGPVAPPSGEGQGEGDIPEQRVVPPPPQIPSWAIAAAGREERVVTPPPGEGMGKGQDLQPGAISLSPQPSPVRGEQADEDARALVEKARAYLTRMQHIPQTIELLKWALEADPANGEAYLLLGDAYLQQDDVAQAARYYSHAGRHLAPDSRLGREARLKLKVLQEAAQSRAVMPVAEVVGTVSAADMRRTVAAGRTYGYAERPGCVTLYAALAVLVGILALAGGVLLALAGSAVISFLEKMNASLSPSVPEIFTWLAVGVGVALATVNVAIAAGLWRMKNWARIVVVVTNILAVLIVVCPAVLVYAGLSQIFTASLLAGVPTLVWAIPLAGLALALGAAFWFATHRRLFD